MKHTLAALALTLLGATSVLAASQVSAINAKCTEDVGQFGNCETPNTANDVGKIATDRLYYEESIKPYSTYDKTMTILFSEDPVYNVSVNIPRGVICVVPESDPIVAYFAKWPTGKAMNWAATVMVTGRIKSIMPRFSLFSGGRVVLTDCKFSDAIVRR